MTVQTHDPKTHYRSKTVAAWLALLLGSLGLHRMYLHGLGDRWAWAFPLPTAAGLLGVSRMDTLGQDDRLAGVLIPLLGLMITVSMLTAIVYALTPDEKWDARHNPGQAVTATGWGPVLAAIAGLLIGGAVMMGTIAYSGQKFFEWQLEQPAAQNSSRLSP
ncbi:MAG: NINE protein [Rubrivivax sp.]|nr:NINE protein [Rubrivivax sp.]